MSIVQGVVEVPIDHHNDPRSEAAYSSVTAESGYEWIGVPLVYTIPFGGGAPAQKEARGRMGSIPAFTPKG